ncbi:cytidylyltransferase domain-containing protein [Leucobacter sp. NPDC058333]|uniref:cytidylyltransferase domain-containing protein n=1 Tax=Leucobacter sp. NPDC058333 TaxID=3346450 RepID=UPI0036684394
MTLNRNAWILIPARGGSVGVPRKNLRLLAGKPMIAYAIDAALSVVTSGRVIVITDDAEVSSVAEHYGAEVILETQTTPSDETLDTKILRNLPALRARGARDSDPVLTVQPTSPLITPATIRRGIEAFANAEIRSVLTVALDQHLRWKQDASGVIVPNFTARVNRQQLPLEYRETGGIIAARLGDIAAEGTRVIEPVAVLRLSGEESVDIDTYADLLAAAHLLTRRRIAIRVDASRSLGMGHVYRMLAFAAEVARHDLTIYLDENEPLGQTFFAATPYDTAEVSGDEDFLHRLSHAQPDLIVLDVLDTTADWISSLREAAPKAQIVSFEDRGSGAGEVDLLVAEFIDTPDVPERRKITGIEFALLAPAFELPRDFQPHAAHHATGVSEVLVLFGGTDPSELALRALSSLERVAFDGRVTVVRGLGAPPLHLEADALPFTVEILENVSNMPALMSRAQLAFTSAGRTVIELLSCGVPSICLAQNEKELTHTHATEDNGVLPLGLGSKVTDDALDGATRLLLDDHVLRADHAAKARAAGRLRSNRKTISAMFDHLGIDVLSVY